MVFCYILIGFIGWNFFHFIFTSPWFEIREVHIEGNHYLDHNKILSLAESEYFFNIFMLDTSQIYKKLLVNPWIEGVSIQKRYPNRLYIKINERQPEIVVFDQESYYLISHEGIILTVLAEIDKDYSPYIVKGYTLNQRGPGDTLDRSILQKLQKIIQGLNSLFPGDFDEIHFVSENEFILFHKRSKLAVRIESGEQLISEWYLLVNAMQRISSEEIPAKEINMKYKDRLSIILMDQIENSRE